MRKKLFGILILTILTTEAMAAVQEQEINYTVDSKNFKGYLAYNDDTSTKRPGILVVPEWWGNNEYARHRAKMLAELGYVAFAIDMFGDGKVAQNPEEARTYVGEVNSNGAYAEDRFKAALQILKDFRYTDKQHIAAIGYCFGGGIVLKMAMIGLPLDAVVSFHGTLPSIEPKPGQVKAKILVCQGGADRFTSPEQIAAFKSALDKAGAEYQFKIYENALHGFTNPEADSNGKKFNMPIGYNSKADQESWKDMQAFLKTAFQTSK